MTIPMARQNPAMKKLRSQTPDIDKLDDSDGSNEVVAELTGADHFLKFEVDGRRREFE